MKTKYREHPLGTPGLSARLKAPPLGRTERLLRVLSAFFQGSRRPVSSWEKGAEGEVIVAKALSRLSRDRWMTLHDLPLGKGGRNVDHLVIGPAGVLSVNTKNLSGKVLVKRNAFLVGNFPDRALHIARDEAARVAQRLTSAMQTPVEVVPVIAVLAPALEVRDEPEGVHVVEGRSIARWLDAQPHVLDRVEAARVYECARRNATWRG